MNLAGGGTSTRPFTIAGPGTLEFAGGTYNFNAGSTIAGAGLAHVLGGTLNVNTPLIPGGSFHVSNGTVNGASNITLNNAFLWSGGIITGGGLLTTNGATDVTGAVTLTDKVWNNANGGGVTMTGDSSITLGGSGATPATLNNQLGATIIDQSTNATPITFTTTQTNKSFINAGTFTKAAGSSATQTLNLLVISSGNSINVDSGTLQLSAGGTHTGLFNIANEAVLDLSGGTHNFNAGVSVAGAGTFRVSTGATLNGNADLTLNGLFNWTGGVITGGGLLTTSNTASTSVTGLVTLTDKVWNNSGAVGMTGDSRITLEGSGAIPTTLNHLSGTFTDQSTNDTPIHATTTQANKSFVNAGTFNKDLGSSDTQTLNVAVVSSGNSINVNSGTLRLAEGGTHTGLFNIANLAVLDLSGGTHNFNAGVSVAGAGTFRVSAGTLNGNANLTLNGLFNWAGGTITGGGVLRTNGATSVTGAATLLDKVWNNANAVTMTGNSSITLGGAGATPTTFNNLAGASISDQSTNATPITVATTQANKSFVNAGSFTKAAGSNATQTINVAVVSSGNSIHVDSGTLQLAQGGTHTGLFNILGNAVLDLSGGTHIFNAGVSVAGPGTFRVSAGTLNGNADLTLNGLFEWIGGTITGSGVLTTGALSTTTMNALGGGPVLQDKVWNNFGTATLGGTGSLVLAGAGAVPTTLNNQGGGNFIVTSTNDSPIALSTTATNKSVLNAGIFTQNPGTALAATKTIGVAVTNTGTFNVSSGTLELTRFPVNSGTLNVDAGAALTTGSAALANASGATLNVNGTLSTGGQALTNASTGTVGGAGTVDLNGNALTNSGRLRPGAATGDTTGTLSITGNLVQNAGSQVDLELGGTAAGAFDLVAVSGAATLTGTVNVANVAGYTPAVGDTFQVITSNSRSGNFLAVNKTFATPMTAAYNNNGLRFTIGGTNVVTWLSTSGDWSAGGNWDLGHAPGPGEIAVIPTDAGGLSGTQTITLPAVPTAPTTVPYMPDTLTSNQNIVIAGSTLALLNPSTITGANLTLTGGALQGAGSLTVTGGFTSTGGSIATTGGLIVTGTSNLNTGTIQVPGKLTTGTLDMPSGTLNIATGGVLRSPVRARARSPRRH